MDSPAIQEIGPTLTVKASKSRALSSKRHPWVYSNDVDGVPEGLVPGQACALNDARGRFLGHGVVNPNSNILWRRYSAQKTEPLLDQRLLHSRIQKAIKLRENAPYCRLVWSDADALPGLIVDRFGEILVVQSVTAAMDIRLDSITRCLEEILSPREIIFRCDAPTRSHEGLTNSVYSRSGNTLEEAWYEIEGIQYRLDLHKGQKTGFYLDQIAQHQAVAKYASQREVLDICCNQGAFALHCARAGASYVRALDISETCIAATQQNAQQNGLTIDTKAANAFDYLKSENEKKWDLIILDPPSFARNRRSVGGALRGYKELNLRAFQALKPGGILATYSCSHHVHTEEFNAVVAEAASDAKMSPRILEWAHQPKDHPVLVNFPESQYLKGLILSVD